MHEATRAILDALEAHSWEGVYQAQRLAITAGLSPGVATGDALDAASPAAARWWEKELRVARTRIRTL